MKIRSLNSEHTKSRDQVAFNVDDPFPPEIMRLVQFGIMRLSLDGSVLHASWRTEPMQPAPLIEKTIIGLNAAFDKAQTEADEANAKKTLAQKRLMDELSGQTKLPVE